VDIHDGIHEHPFLRYNAASGANLSQNTGNKLLTYAAQRPIKHVELSASEVVLYIIYLFAWSVILSVSF
jgi:hypothetical protein